MTPTLSLRRVLPVLALYVIISALGLHAHELFLDEAHHFLLARDSATLAEMYNNARYDGHPRLWHAHLFFTFASLGLYGYLFIEYAGQKKLLTRPFFPGIPCP